MIAVAQLVEHPATIAGGRGFKLRRVRQFLYNYKLYIQNL